ncbi:MAG: penicillin-binding protein 1A [Thermoanaerobaculia bacterium]
MTETTAPPEPAPEDRVEETPPPKRRRRVSLILPLFVALVLGVPSGFLFARLVKIPLVESLDTYRPNIITRLYDRKGKVFADYAIQRRIVVGKRDMAPHLVQAIVSTEDAAFYEHGGIDPKAIARAGIKDLIARKKVEGASTLTQQLAKQLFLTPEKSWRRKINEAFLAVEIEKRFTKDQIFELYANQVYLGHGAYGAEAAARLYFGKHAKDLTIPEAATIAGMIRRPMYYSPINNPENALRRRNHVLRRMLETRSISREQYQHGLNTPLALGTYRDDTPEVGAYFSEEVRQYIEKSYGAEPLYRNGLEVWTTLDVEMQLIAEKALQRGLRTFDHRRGFRKPARNVIDEGIEPETFVDPAWVSEPVPDRLYPAVVIEVAAKKVSVRMGEKTIELPPAAWSWTRKETLAKHLRRGDVVSIRMEPDAKTKEMRWLLDQVPQVQGALVALDVKSGEVVALVGGYDFTSSKFNRAVQSLRQTGSSFKPFVYGAAFENGFTPGDTLFDAPVEIQVGNQTYAPRNYYGKYAGIVTIQRALELSINIPAVKTFMIVGGDKVVDFARRLGLKGPLPAYPSLSLGAAGASPLEMTAAYNVFANQGVYVKPRFIRKITDSTQKVIEDSYTEIAEGTTAQVAYLVTHTMEAVIDRGTGYAAHSLPGPYAGKTGTTNGFTDAWFVGYSTDYAVGVWVGYDDPIRSLGGGATGADIALPIWIDFFEGLDEQKLRTPAKAFDVPPGIVIAPMDLYTGQRGSGPCGRVVEGAFIAGTEPAQDCSGASVKVSKLPYYLQRPFYQPKEAEPTKPAEDASARPGEGAESPAPETEELEPVVTTTTG